MIRHKITFNPRDLEMDPRFVGALTHFINSAPRREYIHLRKGKDHYLGWLVVAYIDKKGDPWGLTISLFPINRGKIHFYPAGRISLGFERCRDSIDIIGNINFIEVRNGERHYLIRPQNIGRIRLVGISNIIPLKRVVKKYGAYLGLVKGIIKERELQDDPHFGDADMGVVE